MNNIFAIKHFLLLKMEIFIKSIPFKYLNNIKQTSKQTIKSSEPSPQKLKLHKGCLIKSGSKEFVCWLFWLNL